MKDLHFIAVESMNFAPRGALNDVILTVHRFLSTYPEKKIQLSFTQAVVSGFHKSLGRRAVLFGSKSDLELFWSINGEFVEQTCSLISPSGIAVRSFDKLIQNQPQAIRGYAIFARRGTKGKARLMADKAEFYESKGYAYTQEQLSKWADERISNAPQTVETLKYFSKTGKKRVDLNIAVKMVEADGYSIDPTEITNFGLSTVNVLPILNLQ